LEYVKLFDNLLKYRHTSLLYQTPNHQTPNLFSFRLGAGIIHLTSQLSLLLQLSRILNTKTMLKDLPNIL